MLEHTFTNAIVNRITLDFSGDKYYFLDSASQSLILYNSDYTLWKTVALPLPIGSNYYSNALSFISEHQLNQDDLLEVGYSYTGIVSEGKIVNENNADLLTIPNAESMKISVLDGYESKVIASIRHDIPGYSTYTSNIYQLPGFAIENEYESEVERVILENSGEKYYTSLNPLNNQAKIYNSDHTLWKTINLPVPDQFYTIRNVGNVSENKFNDDNLIELSYNAVSEIFELQFVGEVINENGLNLLEAYGVSDFYFSELEDLPTKLIGIIYFYDEPATYMSQVYTLGPLTTIDFEKKNILIAPNPASSFVVISSPVFINESKIFSLTGVLLQQEQSSEIVRINIEKLPDGIYFLSLRDSNGSKSIHKIVVAH